MNYASRCFCGVLVLVIFGVQGLVKYDETPVPVQIAVQHKKNHRFKLLRPDLVFRSSDDGVFFRKRLWRESTLNTTPLVSLEVNGDQSNFLNQQFVFLTRDAKLSSPYPQLPIPRTFSDDKLFMSKNCESGVSIYNWQTNNGSIAYLSAKDNEPSSNKDPSLTVAIQVSKYYPNCLESDESILEAPYLWTPRDDTSPPSRRTGQIFLNIPNRRLALAVRPTSNGSYQTFPTTPSCKRTVSRPGSSSPPLDTVFIQRVYGTSYVNEKGILDSQLVATLQHQATGLFLTADVLDDMTLNVGDKLSGLKFKAFDDDEPASPDYRFFLRFWLWPAFVNKRPPYPGVAAVVLCPLYHNRYCIVQSNTGTFQLVPINSTDVRKTPTFRYTPPFGDQAIFSEFLTKYGNSVNLMFQGL